MTSDWNALFKWSMFTSPDQSINRLIIEWINPTCFDDLLTDKSGESFTIFFICCPTVCPFMLNLTDVLLQSWADELNYQSIGLINQSINSQYQNPLVPPARTLQIWRQVWTWHRQSHRSCRRARRSRIVPSSWHSRPSASPWWTCSIPWIRVEWNHRFGSPPRRRMRLSLLCHSLRISKFDLFRLTHFYWFSRMIEWVPIYRRWKDDQVDRRENFVQSP